MGARTATTERERALAELAGRQEGVASRCQLLALGFSRDAIAGRLEQGRLHRIHAGVYAVGCPRPSLPSARWAAVLAGGRGTVLSHQSAAGAWSLLPEGGPERHVTVLAGNGSRSQTGFVVHRTRLSEEDVAVRAGLPLTSVARTLIDLGDVLRAQAVRRAFVRAEQLRLLDMDQVVAALERAGRRRGPATLRGILRAYDPRWQATRSGLELRMLDIVRRHGFPEPEVNAWIDGRWEADLLWRGEGLIVEVDGDVVHATAEARSRDALRDRALRALGLAVLRIPERALDRPDEVADRLRRALNRPVAVRARM